MIPFESHHFGARQCQIARLELAGDQDHPGRLSATETRGRFARAAKRESDRGGSSVRWVSGQRSFRVRGGLGRLTPSVQCARCTLWSGMGADGNFDIDLLLDFPVSGHEEDQRSAPRVRVPADSDRDLLQTLDSDSMVGTAAWWPGGLRRTSAPQAFVLKHNFRLESFTDT